jgi:hypothetical protein
MIVRLRPVGLDELGRVAAIELCVEQWQQRLPEDPHIDKHARAQQAKIALERVASRTTGLDEFHLSVTDDGCGTQAGKRTSRF